MRVRWLGRVPYNEAHAWQSALHASSADNYLLFLEHPDVFTLGVRGDPAHVLVDPASVGATLVRTNRGGDVTYHGPGQLVAYPIVNVPMGPGAVPGHVHAVEQMVIDGLAQLGLASGRLPDYPGVWIDPDGPSPRKICAVGVRISRGRSMHGLALNIDPDMEWFDRIVPCGLTDMAVTSLATEGIDVTMADVVDLLAGLGAARWAPHGAVDRQDVDRPDRRVLSTTSVDADVGRATVPLGSDRPEWPAPGGRLRIRLRQAGVDPEAGLALAERKPWWLRVPARMGDDFLALRHTVRDLDLVTVCEEAGCPNIFECWADGTATFMINGERCTRGCGFCLVDTRHPLPIDLHEPQRVADAVERLGLHHAVVTAVARDDLADGGASAFVATIDAIRERCPMTAVEILVPDCKGSETALDALIAARPDIFNHNLETVARLQRAVRPSAGYARSLAVLARAKQGGLTVKSGLIVGMGESQAEVVGALADLRGAGVDIVTIGQYLRPSATHLPVTRWWTPDEFDALRDIGEAMGFAHVQSSPLTRSSYHARAAASAATSGPSAPGSTNVHPMSSVPA